MREGNHYFPPSTTKRRFLSQILCSRRGMLLGVVFSMNKMGMIALATIK